MPRLRPHRRCRLYRRQPHLLPPGHEGAQHGRRHGHGLQHLGAVSDRGVHSEEGPGQGGRLRCRPRLRHHADAALVAPARRDGLDDVQRSVSDLRRGGQRLRPRGGLRGRGSSAPHPGRGRPAGPGREEHDSRHDRRLLDELQRLRRRHGGAERGGRAGVGRRNYPERGHLCARRGSGGDARLRLVHGRRRRGQLLDARAPPPGRGGLTHGATGGDFSEDAERAHDGDVWHRVIAPCRAVGAVWRRNRELAPARGQPSHGHGRRPDIDPHREPRPLAAQELQRGALQGLQRHQRLLRRLGHHGFRQGQAVAEPL
mmetsp:Transcript_41234/g.104973  ORF Transcript_41234/g.104973 Transcript_41234/m.104973 type:complete len:314 (+) Transcript_41234:430-1371(+)